MNDPFSVLKKTLESVFHFAPKRNGKFVYLEMEQLKKALEAYQPGKKETFIALVRSLRATLPHFEKWRINFDEVRESFDALAKMNQTPINWDKLLAHPKVSPRFQFSAANNVQEVDFLTWISELSAKKFQLNHSETDLLDALIACEETPGFSQKFTFKLQKDPQFLSQFIMDSEPKFIKVLNARLALYLTDVQIAKALIKYLPDFQKDQDLSPQVEQQIDKLNGLLSNSGRSVFTLLRNTEAKSVLDRSEYFRIYQSDEYKNRQEEEESMKPRM
jgi:hypothetical protein